VWEAWRTFRKYLIGTGGWAYFQVPGLKSLTAYSRVFNFVEVNSTFYQIPPLKEVESWRRLVPPVFKFSVRAHQSITHKYRLQPLKEVFEAFESMKQVCIKLEAVVMHLQLPSSFELTKTSIAAFRSLLSSVNLQELRLALEVRGTRSKQLPSELLKTMQDYNIVHCTDLSSGDMPAYESDILYTRLFGKGQHNVYQPTDDELLEIDKKASSVKSEKIVMSFHFVRMYKDAARLKTYKQSGKFPSVTRSTGLASLEEVLGEDARFPSTRQELIHSQGWKIFDLTETERIHVRDLLKKLPDATYNDLGEIVDKLKPVVR
jgi:uncharacterized protein YecE (DUF72 family)